MKKFVLMGVGLLTLVSCSESENKTESVPAAPTTASAPVQARTANENGSANGELVALEAEKAALQSRYQEARAAYAAARAPWLVKSAELKAAKEAKNLILISSLQAELAVLNPAFVKAGSEFWPLHKQWNDLDERIKAVHSANP